MSLGQNDDNFARMNARDDTAFWNRVVQVAFLALVATGIALAAAAVAHSAATASVAQTAACHPDCAVGPYHLEEAQP